MATPLDTTLIEKFSYIFPFLLVLVVTYGILSVTKPFKESKGLNAMAAIAIAFLFMLSDLAVETVKLMAPWFVILFMFIMFLLVAYKMFGATDKDIFGVLKGSTYGGTISYWILAMVMIIVLGSFSHALAKRGGFGPAGAGAAVNVSVDGGVQGQEKAFWDAITHPKTLGMSLIFLIATFTIMKLTAEK